MLFKSPVYSQVSGSIAGITYSHNKAGLYARARAIPVDPATGFQIAVRNFMAILTNAWVSELTAQQRADWDMYAMNVTITGKLGDQVTISGMNHYVRSNLPRLQNLLTRVDDAPTVFSLGDFTMPVLGAITAGLDVVIVFTEADAWVSEDDSSMLVYLSRPQNQSINFFKGPYRMLGSIDGQVSIPPTSPETFTSPFTFVIGQRLFGYVRVTRADGRLSTLARMQFDVIV